MGEILAARNTRALPNYTPKMRIFITFIVASVFVSAVCAHDTGFSEAVPEEQQLEPHTAPHPPKPSMMTQDAHAGEELLSESAGIDSREHSKSARRTRGRKSSRRESRFKAIMRRENARKKSEERCKKNARKEGAEEKTFKQIKRNRKR